MSTADWRKFWAAIAAIAVLGTTAVVVATNGGGGGTPATSTTTTSVASTTTTRPTTTVAPTTTTTVVSGLGKAPIFTRSDQVPDSPRSADDVRRLLVPLAVGQRFVVSSSYMLATVDTRTATEIRHWWRSAQPPGAYVGLADGGTSIWNPAWRPSTGNDQYLAGVNPATGEAWEWYQPRWRPTFPAEAMFACTSLDHILAGASADRDGCASGVIHVTDPAGVPIDIRTSSANSPWSSGGGIQNWPTAITTVEIDRGVIPHVVKIFSPNTMYGQPVCTDAQVDDPKAFGVTCSGALAPAGQYEGINAAAPVAGSGTIAWPRTDTVAEGSRFQLTMTDAQIDSIIQSKGLVDPARRTARIILVAMRDYGFMVLDTSGYSILLQLAGAPADWAPYGVVGEWLGLDQVLTPARVVAKIPATNTCADRKRSRSYCAAYSSDYLPR